MYAGSPLNVWPREQYLSRNEAPQKRTFRSGTKHTSITHATHNNLWDQEALHTPASPMAFGKLDASLPTSPRRQEWRNHLRSRWSVSTVSTMSTTQESDFYDDETPTFHYYLPHASTSCTDLYTDNSWTAYDVLGPESQVETPDVLRSDFGLFFFQHGDFDYYSRHDRMCDGINAATKEGLDGARGLRKMNLARKKMWEDSRLHNVFSRAFGKLRMGSS